jgi:hypothetical protein
MSDGFSAGTPSLSSSIQPFGPYMPWNMFRHAARWSDRSRKRTRDKICFALKITCLIFGKDFVRMIA